MKKLFSAFVLAIILVGMYPGGALCAQENSDVRQPVERSPEENALRKAAEGGDPVAQYELGLALVRPIPPHFGPNKEGEEAAVWLEKSANQGNLDAAFLLGYITQYAAGVTKNVGQGVSWLTKAANGGHIAAMVTLAAVYKVGDGVMKDKIKARNLYAKAAERGNNNARTALAAMYMDGDGVHQDGKIALAWFKRAVADKHAPAMLGLGRLYAKSEFNFHNGAKAIYWTHQAVAHGYAPAVYALGLLHRDGVGTVPPDAYRAYLWLKLSFELSGKVTGKQDEIPYWLGNAERALPPEQLKKADAELAVWLKKGPPSPAAREPE